MGAIINGDREDLIMINTGATQKNIKDIVKTIGTITNTMSKVILNNRKEIELLKARVKELENK